MHVPASTRISEATAPLAYVGNNDTRSAITLNPPPNSEPATANNGKLQNGESKGRCAHGETQRLTRRVCWAKAWRWLATRNGK